MAGPITLSGERTIEYIRRFPTLSKQAIARKLLKDFPLLYNTLGTARQSVCWHTGKMGNKSRTNKKEDFVSNYSRDNPFGFPESYEEVRKPYILPKVNNNILIISDLHVPYHNIKALTRAIEYGVKEKVNTVFINGDLIDFHGFSRFLRDPSKRSPKHEMDAARSILEILRKNFPTAQIYYHLGNHDIRYENFLKAHPELFEDDYYHLESRLRLIDLRIYQIDDKTITKAGKLSIHHGHYIFRSSSSPVSPARTLLLRAKQSMICAHTHKISEATATNLDAEIYSTWSSGCLCELLPDYNPMANDNAHGFAHAVIKDDGSFSLKNFRIKDGKIL